MRNRVIDKIQRMFWRVRSQQDLDSGMVTHDETDRKVRNILTGPGACWDQINA